MDIIEKVFQDYRRVRQLDNNNYQLFCAEDNSIIYLDMVMSTFDVNKLNKYIELAEKLYAQFNTKIYIYLIATNNADITVKEMDIPSEAEFTIRLASAPGFNPHLSVLNLIKEKVKNNQKLNSEELRVLEILPVVCSEEDRQYIRKEVLTILNQL